MHHHKDLELSEGKKVKIWTNSEYAFNVVYVSEVTWKERGLPTVQGNGIEHTEEIHALLQSIWKSREVAFMHCKAHRNGETTPELENHFADEIVKGAAEKGILTVVPQKEIDLSGFTPKYDQKDHQLTESLKAETKESKWAITPERQIVVPPLLLWEIAQ